MSSNSGLHCTGSLSEDSHVTVIVDYIVEVALERTQSCDSESDKIPNILQCTLPPCLNSQTLLSDFSRVWL